MLPFMGEDCMFHCNRQYGQIVLTCESDNLYITSNNLNEAKLSNRRVESKN